MNPTPTQHPTDNGLDIALLLHAADDGCEPRTVLFEAVAEAETADKIYKSYKSHKSDKTYKSDNSDSTTDKTDSTENPDKSDDTDPTPHWSVRLYAALMELEAYETAHPGSGPDIDRAVRRLALLAADITAGNFSASHVADMLRLLDYDEALRRAGEAGELRGRNEAIRHRLDKDFGGDGVPSLSGSGSAGSVRRAPNIFDLAAQA